MDHEELTFEEALAAVGGLPADKVETLRKYAEGCYRRVRARGVPHLADEATCTRNGMAAALRAILAGRDTWERIAAVR